MGLTSRLLSGTVLVSGNTFANNSQNGLRVYESTPAITGNTFTGNGNYGLYIDGLPLQTPVSGNTLSGNTTGQIGMDPDGRGP